VLDLILGILEGYLRLEVVLGVPFEAKVAVSEGVAQNTARMTRIEWLYCRWSLSALFVSREGIACGRWLSATAEVEDFLRAKRLRKGRVRRRWASRETSRRRGQVRKGHDVSIE
jgi:hypothetical protein